MRVFRSTDFTYYSNAFHGSTSVSIGQQTTHVDNTTPRSAIEPLFSCNRDRALYFDSSTKSVLLK